MPTSEIYEAPTTKPTIADLIQSILTGLKTIEAHANRAESDSRLLRHRLVEIDNEITDLADSCEPERGAWPNACESCGSMCFYATSFCNFGHCLHCGEATNPEHAECNADPQMMAAEYADDFEPANRSKYTECPRCGEELAL